MRISIFYKHTCILLFADPSLTEVTSTPSPYHLLDHEYGITTPKDQIITRPLLSPVKAQVSALYIFGKTFSVYKVIYGKKI